MKYKATVDGRTHRGNVHFTLTAEVENKEDSDEVSSVLATLRGLVTAVYKEKKRDAKHAHVAKEELEHA
jgi:hypothetical protein